MTVDNLTYTQLCKALVKVLEDIADRQENSKSDKHDDEIINTLVVALGLGTQRDFTAALKYNNLTDKPFIPNLPTAPSNNNKDPKKYILNVVDGATSSWVITPHTITTAQKNLLRSISYSATPNAKFDWAETNTTSVNYIKNKPSESTKTQQEQADWSETNPHSSAYIRNKPTGKEIGQYIFDNIPSDLTPTEINDIRANLDLSDAQIQDYTFDNIPTSLNEKIKTNFQQNTLLNSSNLVLIPLPTEFIPITAPYTLSNKVLYVDGFGFLYFCHNDGVEQRIYAIDVVTVQSKVEKSLGKGTLLQSANDSTSHEWSSNEDMYYNPYNTTIRSEVLRFSFGTYSRLDATYVFSLKSGHRIISLKGNHNRSGSRQFAMTKRLSDGTIIVSKSTGQKIDPDTQELFSFNKELTQLNEPFAFQHLNQEIIAVLTKRSLSLWHTDGYQIANSHVLNTNQEFVCNVTYDQSNRIYAGVKDKGGAYGVMVFYYGSLLTT